MTTKEQKRNHVLVGLTFAVIALTIVIFISGDKIARAIKLQPAVSLDIHDPSGICGDAYAEGFKWGVSQIPLQVGIWETPLSPFAPRISQEELKKQVLDYVHEVGKEIDDGDFDPNPNRAYTPPGT